MALTSDRYRPHLVYAGLALTVLLPLLRPGFILTLDMVFTPHIHVPSVTSSSYLFYATLHVLNFVIPSDILEKLVLFGILYLSGIGMYRLVQRHRLDTIKPGAYAALGAYVAGALYAINPFTYSRFMAGQFAVLLGYSLLPLFATSLFKLVHTPTWRNSIIVAAWATLIGILSVHTLGLLLVLVLAALILAPWRLRGQFKQLAAYSALGLLLFLLASSYWLIPLATGHSSAGQAVSSFSASDEQAFATAGNSAVGKLANVLRLQGFWAENQGFYTLPQTHMLGWGIVMLGLWVLVIIGARACWQHRQQYIAAVLLTSAAVAILLAIGSLNTALAKALPLFNGFREPHKFIGLLALAYAYFAGQGIAVLLARLRNNQAGLNTLIVVVLLLPVLLTPTMFWAFGQQLHARQYPATWAAMNTRLNHDASSYKVLFLPWHLYMYYGFADRIIASPAPSFFDTPMVTSNDPEYLHASPTNPYKLKTLLGTHILPGAAKQTTLGKQLAPLHIKYVLLDKDNDYKTYDYLDKQRDLRLIHDDANFRLYLNTDFRR